MAKQNPNREQSKKKYDKSIDAKKKRQWRALNKVVESAGRALLAGSWSEVPKPFEPNTFYCVDSQGNPDKDWAKLKKLETTLLARMSRCKSDQQKAKAIGTTARELRGSHDYLIDETITITAPTPAKTPCKKGRRIARRKAKAEANDSDSEASDSGITGARKRSIKKESGTASDVQGASGVKVKKEPGTASDSDDTKIKSELESGSGTPPPRLQQPKKRKQAATSINDANPDAVAESDLPSKRAKFGNQDRLKEIEFLISVVDFFFYEGKLVWQFMSREERSTWAANNDVSSDAKHEGQPRQIQEAQVILESQLAILNAIPTSKRSAPSDLAPVDEGNKNYKKALHAFALILAGGLKNASLQRFVELSLHSRLAFQTKAVILTLMLRQDPTYNFTAMPSDLCDLANAIGARSDPQRNFSKLPSKLVSPSDPQQILKLILEHYEESGMADADRRATESDFDVKRIEQQPHLFYPLCIARWSLEAGE